ncbi:MAG: hypothetical protein N2486_02505 [Caloramator sp.]|nr:hypothetical protein [Caloramator sp.]
MEELEGIIKNIIHIDKNAVEMRERFKNEIENKKRQIEEEIERLRRELLDERLSQITKEEEEILNLAKKKAEELVTEAEETGIELEKRYYNKKEDLLNSAFNELFN